MITKSYCWKKTAVAVAAVALLGLGTGSASALSLGSMTVHSALGEPLRAEIDVTSISSEEVNSVTMRIAPPDAFVAAGLEYNSVLKNTLVTLQRRPNGQPYIRVSSNIPINDPYVDLILEANSSSGRVARDYPMLFDPPVRSQAANNVAANRPTLAQVPMDDFDSYPSYPSPAQATPSYATAQPASPYRIPIIDDSPRTANNSTASNVTGVTNGGVTSRNISETSPAAATGGTTTVATADEFPDFAQNTSDPVNVNMPPARNARQSSSKARSGSSVVRSKSRAIARLRHPARVQTAAPAPIDTTTTAMGSATAIEVANPSAGASSVVVKPGDTATKIAAALKPANVSLDDMLAALLRANPDAFVKNDVNRMRIGAVLKVPDASTIASGGGNAAGNNPTQSLTAESKNFNEYRRNLATQSPQTATEEAGRKATGKIETKVDDKTASTTTPDKLTLSKGAVQGKSAEAAIANERATKETATRAAEMNKNIADLQKLGASGAIRPASAANPASAATSAARPASAVASATTNAASAASAIASAARLPASHASAAVSASVVASAASSAVSATPAASAALATASSATALASAASPASTASAAASKRPSLTPPVPLEPPSLLDEVLGEDYLLPLLGGGGALLAGLGGLAFWRSRKRKQEMVAEESSFIESRIPSDSFFGASGGQNVDTSQEEEEHANSSAMIYSPSQLNAIDDVDPVAEADVYLAYGRDVQAEEILREALLTNPGRVAIHTKLLEILAKRQDVEAFETAVSQVSQVVKKDSPEWAHICEMGQSVDPANPMYQVGRPANSGTGMQMFASAAPAALTADEPMASSLSHATAVMPDVDLDLDLDFDDEEEETSTAVPPPPVAPAPAPEPAPAPHSNSLNMDLDAALDMDFDLSTPIEPAPAPAPASAPEAADEQLATQSLEEMFNLNFDEPPNAFELPNANASKPAAPKAAAIPAKPDGDGMLLEFNLDDFQLPGSTPTPAAGTMGARLEDPLETKLALAQEFVSIGDEFGAREILEEVIAGASGELQAKARAALAKLG